MANNVACTVACDRIEIITGTGRRKSWSLEEKQRLVAEASSGRGAVAEVSRRYGVCRSLLFRWRRQAERGELAADPGGFVPVMLAGDMPVAETLPSRTSMIEIALPNGRILRVAEDIAPATLARLASALDRR